MKVLYIKANPKSTEQSCTFLMSEKFIAEYQIANPDDQIITVDLYKEKIRPLDEKMLAELYTNPDNEMRKHAELFKSCDKYVFAAPMWNLSIPAILKAYFDYITFAGISFKYTATGPAPLLKDKPRKAVYIVARGGGPYGQKPLADIEMGERYVRTILNFNGISDIETIAWERTNVLQGVELEQAKLVAFSEVENSAKIF